MLVFPVYAYVLGEDSVGDRTMGRGCWCAHDWRTCFLVHVCFSHTRKCIIYVCPGALAISLLLCTSIVTDHGNGVPLQLTYYVTAKLRVCTFLYVYVLYTCIIYVCEMDARTEVYKGGSG